MKDRAPLVVSLPPDALSTSQTPAREPPLRLTDIA
jgi:hypothetical protein